MAQNTQPRLPDAETAFATLFDNVHQQVFFHKLAEVYGIVPQNPAQHAAILEGALRLREIEQSQAYKAAQDEDDPFVAANRHLAQLVGDDVYQKTAQEQDAIGNMAQHLMRDPDLYASVLALKVKQAADLAEQYRRQG